MEFGGEFELEGVSVEDAWLVLSDPVAVQKALPGCEFLIRVKDEDFDFDEYEPEEGVETLPEADPKVVAERAFQEGEEYAALIKAGVASDKREYEGRATIDERDYPSMRASGGGSSSRSAFEMTSHMIVSETEAGSKIKWTADTDISGRLAQMDQRVLIPAVNKIVTQYFTNIKEQMVTGEEAEDGSD